MMPEYYALDGGSARQVPPACSYFWGTEEGNDGGTGMNEGGRECGRGITAHGNTILNLSYSGGKKEGSDGRRERRKEIGDVEANEGG